MLLEKKSGQNGGQGNARTPCDRIDKRNFTVCIPCCQEAEINGVNQAGGYNADDRLHTNGFIESAMEHDRDRARQETQAADPQTYPNGKKIPARLAYGEVPACMAKGGEQYEKKNR